MFAIDRSRQQLLHAGRAYHAATRSWHAIDATHTAEPVDAVTALQWLQIESGHPLRAPIGVIGPNEATAEQHAVAEQVGALIGRMRLTLLCGGRQGVMEAAARGAFNMGGLTLGLLPQNDPDQANPYIKVALASGIGEARNAIIAQASACLIAVGDSHGTLSEVALGLRLGKTVFGLAGAARVEGVIQLADASELARPLAATQRGCAA